MISLQEIKNRVTDKEPAFTMLLEGLVPVKDEEIPTLATDGENLFYNPKFLAQLSEEEQCAVVLHETLHCAFLHMWRRGKRNPKMWNIATDYAINLIVDESFKLPQGTLLDYKYYGMTAEAIYNQLPKDSKDQDWCEKHDWEGNKSKKQKSQPQQGKGIMDKIKKAIMGETEAEKRRKKAKSKMVEQKWKNLFEKSILQQYGKLSDSLKRVIEKQYYVPTIDWASLVASLLSEDTTDYNFSQPDRRFMEQDFVLPDLQTVDKVKDVVFAYDTSGSISQNDLFVFYMETLKLFQNFSNLQGWIGVCDAWLHSFKELDPKNTFDQFDFRGGGGTNFNPVFNEIAKREIKPRALFYFTDTYGDFPSKAPEYPVFWLVRSTIGQQPPHVPFGTVIQFLG